MSKTAGKKSRWVAILAAPLLVVTALYSAHADPTAPAPSASASAKPSASAAASAAPAAPVNPAKWSDAAGFPAVTSDDPMWGSRFAPVTLVVFSDFQCPFCKKLAGTLEELKKKYGADKLRVIHKHNPLVGMHKDARAAAVASETVFRLGGSTAFFDFSQRAFNNAAQLTDANFALWSSAVGVDRKAVTNEVLKAAEKKVDADLALATAVDVTGTPTSFVNGVVVGGSQSAEKFSETIDEQLKLAAALKGKVSPDKVYVHLSKQAKAKAPKKAKPAAKKR